LEEQGTDAPSSADGSQSVGGNDGGGFSDDQAAANQSVTQGYTDNYGLASFGPDTYSQVDAMKDALGITPTNPFGYKGFFSKHFGIDPTSIDYSNQYSNSVGGAQNAMNQIAGLNIGVSQNPNNTPGIMGFDPNQAPNQPRSGIQKGFGSLFGRPTGQMTALGPIAAQRSGKPMDALALAGFNTLAGLSLPGIVSNIVGPPQTYAVKDSIGYDPTKDPALAGNKGLGTLADVVSMSLTGNTTANLQDAYTGASSIVSDMLGNVTDVTSAVEDAVSFGYNPKGGTVGNVVSDKGYTSSTSNYNPNMNDNEGGESKSDRYRPTPDSIPTTELKKAPVVGEDFIDPELLKYIKRRPAAPVSEVGYNQDFTASSSAKPVDFSSFDRGLGSLQSGIATINRNR